MRNRCAALTTVSGNSAWMLALITSSMKTNVSVPGADSAAGSSTNRGRLRGTFTRANLVRPPCCTATARFVLRFETNGNGCPGSNASGVSTGNTSRAEVVAQVRLDLRRPLVRVQEHDALVGELAPQGRPDRGLLVQHGVGDAAHRLQLRRHVEPVRRMILDALAELPQRRRQADHEELVEVGAGDAEELDPLEQRVRPVGGLGQHAAVELEPAQLAVDVQRRVLEILGVDAVEGSLVGRDGRESAIHTGDEELGVQAEFPIISGGCDKSSTRSVN